MTPSINSLHKILKDQTRRKIIVILQEKGALGYTELMEHLEITRTGTLNYNLKTLGDLLAKDNSGRYILSEKGQVAYRVLAEFPNGPPMEQAYKWKRVVASILAIANGISLIVSTLLFFVGYIDWHFFSSQIIYSLVAFLVALIIFKFPTTRPKYDPKRARKLTCYSYSVGGAIFTSIFLFFALGALLISILWQPIPGGPLGNAFWVLSFVGGAMIGGMIGYILFKRSKYSDPSFYSPF